ncbi:DUF4365 domain-containing protein [Mesorhizobium sp. M1050]|uniref:DUF4365 domain-containing protein n=1 Tax=unclassified Mesorhizobium TaxID=325217 RepID=UPI0033385FB7
MSKKIGRADIIGEKGIAHIRQIVLSMGFMFYETGGVEAGIDGYVELRDDTTGVVSNLSLQVQGKATERSRLQAETDSSFEFPVTDSDIQYWMHGTAPVLLIVVKLQDGKAYWKSIKDWFGNAENLSSKKVVFDKQQDAFNVDAKNALVSVAASVRPGSTGPSVRLQESLLLNLLEVDFANTIYWAPTDHGSDKSFGAALRSLDAKAPSEWIVRENAVLSFHDLDKWPWNKVCDTTALEEFDTSEWSDSDDDDRVRDFTALLNRTLGEFTRPNLYRDRDSNVLFFTKPKNREKLNYPYRSLQNTTTRRVVGPYGRQRSNPAKPAYFRHSGFRAQFVCYAKKWFAEVTPTYHFTRDGFEPDLLSGEHLKKIKELENNAAVMGQFVMWRAFLTTHRAGGDLLTEAYPFLRFRETAPMELEVGVPDRLWASQEPNSASPLFDFDKMQEGVE